MPTLQREGFPVRQTEPKGIGMTRRARIASVLVLLAGLSFAVGMSQCAADAQDSADAVPV